MSDIIIVSIFSVFIGNLNDLLQIESDEYMS